MSAVVFHVLGKPEPQGSAKAFVQNGRAVITSDNPRLHSWRNLINVEASRACDELLEGPVFVTALFRLPKSKSRAKRETWAATIPDADKLARGLLDGLTGTVVKDDRQVVRLLVEKRWALGTQQPGVWVRVEAASETKPQAASPRLLSDPAAPTYGQVLGGRP